MEKAIEEKLHLILMDIMLPGMDGREATRRIRSNQETKDIPILVVTALTKEAAEALHNWLEQESAAVDADVSLLGDWNAPPDDTAWKPLDELEQQGKAKFQSINDKTNISHLMYKNMQDIGSRLDLGAISMAAFDELYKPPAPVQWKSLDKLLATNSKAKQIRNYIKQVREKISDHLLVVVRFYIDEQSPAS
ncbi:MAG: response regulator [Nitrososphaerales archaeon]